MPTIYHTATTLDGFLADEHDGLGWLMALGEPEGLDFGAFLDGVGALAMGGNTYRWVLANHREPDGSQGVWPYAAPAWVFTSQKPPSYPGADVRFVAGDVTAHFPAMRAAARERDIWIAGGGDLAGQFYDARLLDEIRVTITSVTLGRGKPLFPRRVEAGLDLVEARQGGSKFVELRYRVSYPS
jgi:dihydrofolate reductase